MTTGEHDKRADESPDPALDRAWREASSERPSDRLDAAILAASRRAVEDPHSRHATTVVQPRPQRWFTRVQPYAAAAAVAALAFALVQTLPREVTSTAPMPRASAPVETRQSRESQGSTVPPVPEPPSASRSAAPETDRATTAPRKNPAPTQDRLVAPPSSPSSPAPSVTAQEAAGDAADVAAPTAGTGDTRERTMTTEMAPRRGELSSGSLAAPAAAAKANTASEKAVVPDARSRADRIAALYAAGDTMAATVALREFRADYPDADAWLAPDVREWARTIE